MSLGNHAKVEIYSVGEYQKVNPCTDPEGRRRIKIGERYRVALLINEGMVSDGMWTTLQHDALFADRKQAEQLADKVLQAVRKPAPPGTWSGLNLAHWFWTPGPTQAFSALQEKPTAIEYKVG